MNEIHKYLEDKHQDMITTLKTVVNMESPSRQKQLLDKLAGKIAEIFEATTGGKTEIIPVEEYGNHVRAEWGTGDEQILVLCHFDTVWPQGTTNTRPFSIDADGIRAYG
ncbi:MAG: hypothetical protein ACRDBM_00145, partial [Sporomusa sp.]